MYMSTEIKSLTPKKPNSPAWWTMFLDGTEPAAFSYARIVGFIVTILFMAMMVYLTITTGVLPVPPQQWVYILVTFGLSKPIQRFAETKDNETQLNYEFQMAQITMGKDPKSLENSSQTPAPEKQIIQG